MKKAIFFDWDGTLSEDGEVVTQETKAALKRVQEKGYLTFLCTGRSYGFLAEESLQLGLDGIVCGAGTYVLAGNQVIFRRCIPTEILSKFVPHILKDGQPCILEGEKQCFLIHFDPSAPTKMKHINSWEELAPLLPENPVSKIGLKKRQMSPETEQLLKPDFSLHYYPTFQEALIPGCTKASGMEKILAHYGIPREAAVGIGDSLNDLEMMDYAGLGIAVGNPCEELCKRADCTAKTVAEAIEIVLSSR